MRVIQKKILLLVLLCACASGNIVAQKITKETIVSQGKKRTYYLYVPKGLTPSSPVPLIVLLHGSGHVGLSLAEKWDGLAKKEGVIIIAPDSADSSHWSAPRDGPVFLHELVEAVKTKYPINAKKVYLFGHSAGATVARIEDRRRNEAHTASTRGVRIGNQDACWLSAFPRVTETRSRSSSTARRQPTRTRTDRCGRWASAAAPPVFLRSPGP